MMTFCSYNYVVKRELILPIHHQKVLQKYFWKLLLKQLERRSCKKSIQKKPLKIFFQKSLKNFLWKILTLQNVLYKILISSFPSDKIFLNKKSHTREEGGTHPRISVWHLLMNFKDNYLLKKLLKWANKKCQVF